MCHRCWITYRPAKGTTKKSQKENAAKLKSTRLKRSLELVDFDAILNTSNLQEKTTKLIGTISNEINHFLPVKSKLIKVQTSSPRPLDKLEPHEKY